MEVSLFGQNGGDSGMPANDKPGLIDTTIHGLRG